VIDEKVRDVKRNEKMDQFRNADGNRQPGEIGFGKVEQFLDHFAHTKTDLGRALASSSDAIASLYRGVLLIEFGDLPPLLQIRCGKVMVSTAAPATGAAATAGAASVPRAPIPIANADPIIICGRVVPQAYHGKRQDSAKSAGWPISSVVFDFDSDILFSYLANRRYCYHSSSNAPTKV
jgi:hypothetical protein